MAEPTKIRVMISSRCNDTVALERVATFSDLRRRLKEELGQEELLDSRLFDVWINEDAPPAEGSVDAWEECLDQVRRADILIVLYNGNGGWAKQDGDVGICHAELATALNTAPAKVRIIRMPLNDITKDPAKRRHERFRQYVDTQARFWATAKDGLEAIRLAREALREAVADMVQLGGREARKGKFWSGDALDWSRLDFEHRRDAIINTMRDALGSRGGSVRKDANVFLQMGTSSVLAACHAVPAAMGVAAAREMVGQPFLRDYEYADLLQKSVVGPVHFVGCHRSVTEAQAMRLLGFPDATIVTAPFGVYVADNIQRIQLLFLANCRDETTTRHAMQRAFEWLEQTGEDIRLRDNADARARIVKAIAAELYTTDTGETKKRAIRSGSTR